MKVFVSGINGFIGTNLSNIFQNIGIIIVNYQDDNKKRINILDKNEFQDIDDVDAIIHLAAKTSIANSVNSPYQTYYTNICGTLNLLDFAREKNIKKIINLSTYVYGKPKYLPIDEKHPTAPHSPYNKSKIIAEDLCKYYSHDYGINIVTLRPFYIYGPQSNQLSFIPSIIQQIKKDGKVYLSGENTKRDFLFVDDFLNLLLKVLAKFPKGYNVYNVGSGRSYSLEQIIKIIEKITGIKIQIHYNKSIRSNDITEMIADITEVKKSFDWMPHTDIEKGIELSIQNLGK